VKVGEKGLVEEDETTKAVDLLKKMVKKKLEKT
jgi:pentatricopeptide repeat protein